GGPTDLYDVVLDSQPTADVTITITPDAQTTVNQPTLTFTTGSWNVIQTVTVTAVDDAMVEGPHSSIITHNSASVDPNYAGAPFNGSGNPYDMTVSVADNDVAGAIDPGRCTVTVDPTSFSTITVTLLDGAGQPVSGKTVTLVSDRGGIDTFTQPAAPTDASGVATGTIRSNTIGAATITATDTTDSVVLPPRPQVFFTQSAVLVVDKRASKEDVVVGDVVTYLVEIRNASSSDVVQVRLDDRIPPNFKFVRGSAKIDGTQTADPTGVQTLSFNIGTVPALVDSDGNGRADPGEAGYVSVSYRLIVGSGATPGDYGNVAVARDVCDTCFISNQAEARVTVAPDPIFDLGTIIGKVFEDRDGDEYQGPDEPGVAEAMVVLDDGTYALTDEHGRYHFPAVEEGQRLVKINIARLPKGAHVTTNETVVLWITPGLLAKANFGIGYQQDTESIGKPAEYGLRMIAEKKEEPIEVVGSIEMMTILLNGEAANLPGCDIHMGLKGQEEVLEITEQSLEEPVPFRVEIDGSDGVDQWWLNIYEAGGELFRSIEGEGNPPEIVFWDGRNAERELVTGGSVYHYQMELFHSDGYRSKSPRRAFGVNQTQAISLTLTGGAFEFDSARLSPKAKAVLKETAKILRKYPNEKIVIAGHTDSVGSEHYNLRLSKKRADAAASYLIKREGISADRLIVRFFGESVPIASNDEPLGQELNRRVEIKGSVDEVRRAKLLDQYRTTPVVKINGSALNMERDGRFKTRLEEEGMTHLEIEMVNSQGREIHA
ncbi:MAG: OmpA family protein, partial [Planctomycetota bacterium]